MEKAEIIREMQDAVTHISETVHRKKAEGRKVVGCAPIFTPEELVIASGAFPGGHLGRAEGYPCPGHRNIFRRLPAPSCSPSRRLSMAGVYDEVDAVLLTFLCDTLKCMSQTIQLSAPKLRPIFVKHPQNYRLECAGGIYGEGVRPGEGGAGGGDWRKNYRGGAEGSHQPLQPGPGRS